MDAVTSSVALRAGDAARAHFHGRSEDADRPRRREHDEHDRGCHRGRGCGEDDASSVLKVSLKAEIEGTFAALAGDDGAADAPAAEFDAELKARIRFDGPEGRVDFKMKLELDDVERDTFDAALQSFTETLYAALRTMFGGEPQAPKAVPGDAAAVTQAALAADAGTDAAAAPATATATPPATDVQIADAEAAAAPAPQPVDTGSADTAAPAPTAQAAAGRGAIDLRIRLSYTSFGDSLGSLLQRLAQPAGSDGAHPLAEDLAASFDRLTAAAGGDAPQRLSLGSFLSALAQRFAPPPAPADDAEAATGDDTAAQTQAEAEAEEAPAPSAPTSGYGVLRFTAEYRQVFNYTTPAPQPLALAA